jgi:pyruvate,orthophosphate dikinase
MSKKATRSKKAAARKSRVQTRPATKLKKYVYFFGDGKADGDRRMRDLLGGKGAGLAEMTNAGLPVPPGFTISTPVCTLYYERNGKLPSFIDTEIAASLKKLEKSAGAKLGDASNPLLVSVRSGAKFSMPGMMDTILNLGLNDRTVEALKARTANGRFAFDSYRRFLQCRDRYRPRRRRSERGGATVQIGRSATNREALPARAEDAAGHVA